MYGKQNGKPNRRLNRLFRVMTSGSAVHLVSELKCEEHIAKEDNPWGFPPNTRYAIAIDGCKLWT